MKKKFILLPLTVLVLGGCTPDAPADTGPKLPDKGTFTNPVAVYTEGIEADTWYKLGLYQGNLGHKIYANGKISTVKDYYLDSTANLAESTDFIFEEGPNDGKYYLRYETEADELKYLNVDSEHHFILPGGDEPTTEWAWDATNKVVTTKVGSDDYFIGTFNTFTTIQMSKLSYLKSGNFASNFYHLEEGTKATELTVKDETEVPTVHADEQYIVHYNLKPANAIDDVTFSADYDKVTFEGNVAKVDKTATEGKEVTITAKSGTLTDTVKIKIGKYLPKGTETEPITVEQALNIAKSTAKDVLTPIVVKGVISSNYEFEHGEGSGNFTDGTNFIALNYKDATFKTGVSKDEYLKKDGLKFKTVTMKGKVKNYDSNGTIKYRVMDGEIIKVEDIAIEATGFKVSKDSVTIEAGKDYTVYVNILPIGANAEVKYEASSDKITYEYNKIKVAADCEAGDYTVTFKVGTFEPKVVKVKVTAAAKPDEGGETTPTVNGIIINKTNTSGWASKGYGEANRQITLTGTTVTLRTTNVMTNGDNLQFKKEATGGSMRNDVATTKIIEKIVVKFGSGQTPCGFDAYYDDAEITDVAAATKVSVTATEELAYTITIPANANAKFFRIQNFAKTGYLSAIEIHYAA